jgi:hypothetical protein
MAGLNENGQWIVMLGFIISIILVFLALIVNQSALIGKTTSESVLEFPKAPIQDLRAEISDYDQDPNLDPGERVNLIEDLKVLSIQRKGVIIKIGLYTERHK